MPPSRVAALGIALALVLVPTLGKPAPAAAAPPKEFYGVAPQRLPSTGDIERMGQGEVGTLRFQLRWSAIDPTPAPGDYDWTESDQVIGDAARNGISALPFVFGTPTWVAAGLDRRECVDNCFAYAPRSHLALEAWARFLTAAAKRYGPGGDFWAEHPEIPPLAVRSWQIWNEQNSIPFFLPRPNIERYGLMLLAAAIAIRGADPGAQLVLGGMYSTPNRGAPPAITAWRFLRRLYAADLEATFDVVAAHPYAATLGGVDRQLERFREVMRRQGARRDPMWVTEVGWSSSTVNHPLNHGPRGQAERLRKLLERLTGQRRQLQLRRVVWFSWRDDTRGLAVCDWCPLSGLFREQTLTPKRSWRAFTRFTGGS